MSWPVQTCSHVGVLERLREPVLFKHWKLPRDADCLCWPMSWRKPSWFEAFRFSKEWSLNKSELTAVCSNEFQCNPHSPIINCVSAFISKVSAAALSDKLRLQICCYVLERHSCVWHQSTVVSPLMNTGFNFTVRHFISSHASDTNVTALVGISFLWFGILTLINSTKGGKKRINQMLHLGPFPSRTLEGPFKCIVGYLCINIITVLNQAFRNTRRLSGAAKFGAYFQELLL